MALIEASVHLRSMGYSVDEWTLCTARSTACRSSDSTSSLNWLLAWCSDDRERRVRLDRLPRRRLLPIHRQTRGGR